MEWNDSFKTFLKETVKSLRGADRRLFMARTVQELGRGGQLLAERELNWNRATIRKGTHELKSGVPSVDAFFLRGRKRAEELLPDLQADIQSIVDEQSQADPKFQSDRLYSRITGAEVRRQLIQKKGYTEEVLPTVVTIRAKLNQWGYSLQKVKKSQPQKKSRKPTTSLKS